MIGSQETIKHDHNLDDQGWYEVGNRKYYNKILALIDHRQSGLPVYWNYNDQAYDAWHWDREPTKSLDQLYAERAQELRNRYDYLVLHWSGGDDSANIIETFIRNNIHLDEVLTWGAISQMPKMPATQDLVSADLQWVECVNQALPLAYFVKEQHMPHLVVNALDITDPIIEFFTNSPDWAESGLNDFVLHGFLIQNLHLMEPRYAKMAEQGKKIGHIRGFEKPNLFKHKDFYYTRWTDAKIARTLGQQTTGQDFPQFMELFYWGKRAIELQIKQLHVMKQHAKTHPESHQFLGDDNGPCPLGRPCEDYWAKVLYRRTLPLLFRHDKDMLRGTAFAFESWFTKNTNHIAYQNWAKGVTYIQSQVPDYFVHAKGRLAGFKSKTRFLGR